MNLRCDVAVVGAGPAGLSAALAAAQCGAQSVLVDAYAQPGGQYFRQPPAHRSSLPTPAQKKGFALWEQAQAAGVQILKDSLVWDARPGYELALSGPHGAQLLSAGALVLATGCYERVAAFPGWTLPGVITAGAVQTLLHQGVLPGARVLLAGSGPLQLAAAAGLLKAGAEVVAVLEGARLLQKAPPHLAALWGQWERLAEGASALAALIERGVPYRAGWGIVAAQGTAQVESATIAPLDRDWQPIRGRERQVACDTVAIGYGFIPFDPLARMLGAEVAWQAELGAEALLRDDRLQTNLPGLFAAGDGAGIGGAQLAQLEGRLAGQFAAAYLGFPLPAGARSLRPAALRRQQAFQRLYAALFTPGPGLYALAGDDTPVCRCEEVTQGQLRQAYAMGAGSLAELKSITRCGMGACQGRMCEAQLRGWLSRASGRPVTATDSYTARPPLFPVPLNSLVLESDERL